ncbi:hypothetical protein CEXT_584821 [Caerostris extrusa]|uniref:Uncharacterized protein n=1 Tax=Caerostris extrusa TaxID=172846 RepID=A0AAV4T331_CAEEX|nr:hypothetical protein CEXT_584821 [Caerostris extrusa]
MGLQRNHQFSCISPLPSFSDSKPLPSCSRKNIRFAAPLISGQEEKKKTEDDLLFCSIEITESVLCFQAEPFSPAICQCP